MKAAPSQRETAPTIVMHIGGVGIRASVQRRQPWETRSGELASGNASGEGGGAVTNHPCYQNNVLHGHTYDMVIYLHGW